MRGLVLTLGALACVPVASCLDPTEIDVVLQTDVDPQTLSASGGALVRVGTPTNVDTTPSTSFQTSQCDDAGNMGDFYVVPSASPDDDVAIDVELGVDVPTSQCDPAPNAGCIYARRQLTFLRHARVLLPIRLDRSCLGVACPDGQTCDEGTCTGDIIDPSSCDGGGCTPIEDGGNDGPALPDAGKEGGPDATLGCVGPKTQCGTACVDLSDDLQNCGACGLDCSQGTCTNGTCNLGVAKYAQCLAVTNNEVYVATGNDVVKVPTSGGTPQAVLQYPSSVIAAASTHAVANQSSQPPAIVDFLNNVEFSLYDTVSPNALATSDSGFAFLDFKAGTAYYAPITTTNAPSPITLPIASPPDAGAKGNGWVAVAKTTVFVTWAGYTCYSQAGQTGSCSTSIVNAPGPIAVADVNNAQSAVFVVSNGTSIVQLDPLLTTKSAYASGKDTLDAITSDGSNVYAIGTNGTASYIDRTSNNVIVQLVTASNPVTSCIAVDGSAVYWLDTSGDILKHAK